MSGFFWNIRGFNKYIKHSVVRDWIRQEKFQFGCVLETRVKETKAMHIVSEVCPDWSTISNYEYNRLGRIWVVWSPKARVTPFFKSSQVITCSILMEGTEQEIFCSFFYASNSMERRMELWSDLMSHQYSPIIRNKPWIIFGYFNEITDLDEHSGHQDMNFQMGGMRDFQEVINHFSLLDMSYQGPRLT